MSGGQWKKIGIYRLFFKNSPIYILDEPTESLDAEAVNDLIRIMNGLSKDVTVIVVSHDTTFLQKICTEVYEMTQKGIDRVDGICLLKGATVM